MFVVDYVHFESMRPRVLQKKFSFESWLQCLGEVTSARHQDQALIDDLRMATSLDMSSQIYLDPCWDTMIVMKYSNPHYPLVMTSDVYSLLLKPWPSQNCVCSHINSMLIFEYFLLRGCKHHRDAKIFHSESSSQNDRCLEV